MKTKKAILVIIAVLFILFLGMQFVPVQRTNPQVVAAPQWDSPQTKTLFYRACADCHSHETKWPVYSKVAPVSWFVAHHVEEGREHFNISIENMGEANEAAGEVYEGHMPLDSYLWLHPEARLSKEEKDALIQGLKATFGQMQEHGE